MPTLISAGTVNHAPHLHFGLSSAANQKLFLENYLEAPIEQILSHAVRSQISREYIAEIGKLSLSHTRYLQQDLMSIAIVSSIDFRDIENDANGRGLGLAIASQIVALHGAKIELIPGNNNQGLIATVSFKL